MGWAKREASPSSIVFLWLFLVSFRVFVLLGLRSCGLGDARHPYLRCSFMLNKFLLHLLAGRLMGFRHFSGFDSREQQDVGVVTLQLVGDAHAHLAALDAFVAFRVARVERLPGGNGQFGGKGHDGGFLS